MKKSSSINLFTAYCLKNYHILYCASSEFVVGSHVTFVTVPWLLTPQGSGYGAVLLYYSAFQSNKANVLNGATRKDSPSLIPSISTYHTNFCRYWHVFPVHNVRRQQPLVQNWWCRLHRAHNASYYYLCTYQQGRNLKWYFRNSSKTSAFAAERICLAQEFAFWRT